jgi:hypothetical protein
VWELAGIWDTRAPERMLGDPVALEGFASSLLTGFEQAAGVVASEAPPAIGEDLEVATGALATLYVSAVDYAAGDMSAIPVQQPEEIQAFGRVRAWGNERCGPPPQ